MWQAIGDLLPSAVGVALSPKVLIGVLFLVLAVSQWRKRPRAGKAAGPLNSIKQFMSDHNAVIMMVVFVVPGVKILGQGLGGLAT